MESDSNDVQFSLRYKQAFDNDPNFTAESPQKHVEDEEIERQIVSCHTDFKKMEIVTKIQNKQKVIKQLLQKSLDHKVAALTLCKRFQTAFQNIPTQRLQIQQMINNWQEEELDTQGTDQTQLNQQIDLNEENIETIENEYNHELKGLNSTCSDFSCCLIKARFLKQLRKRWSPEFQDAINQFKVPQNISQEELALKFAQETGIGLYLLCMLSNTQYSPYEANLYQEESIKQICTGNNDICVHENVQVNKKFQTIIRQSYSYILKSETRQPPKNIIIEFSIINDAMQVIYPQVSYSSYQTLFSSLCGRELPFSLQDKLYEACHEIIKIAENALEQVKINIGKFHSSV
ncbi:hypothetical protein PPERSA_06009 [Pseudocohnilembus persalinus]|uniref:Uncharacterized protein n=1 Tax=Pseudocohnilembus persalinus TaxID=266149 RepID=A0A0V0R0X3_PSEPJ|nr:hypothetical protein PPERSA_06009 [Pseudocohnilembus persalinus]|eukprot:KRX08167.1 hypothetical protein PPERSA_06009 [Pseudocohnilembus persalinus]